MLKKLKYILISISILLVFIFYFFVCTPLGSAYAYVLVYDWNGFPHALSYRFSIKYKSQNTIVYKLNKPFSDNGNYVLEFKGTHDGIIWKVGPHNDPLDFPSP